MTARPLDGIKVLEIQSLGPGPFAAMLLADLGANVLCIARPASSDGSKFNAVVGRPHHGLGPFRTAGAFRGARHQLH
jgi:crotonobetainyl-CoA:carnitine CoA-transferase CaiB-like acyl-CoA transferase